MKVHKVNRNGEKYTMKDGYVIEIVNYNSAHDFDIKYEDGHIQHCTAFRNIKSGSVSNRMHPNKFGGVLGVGEYDTTHPSYRIWKDMLERCSGTSKYSTTYKDCIVCEEWINFQNFAQWYEDNYYISNERLQLDKDIIKKGNRVYCPEHCVFVPETINKLFVKQQTRRGQYPIGISFCSRNGKLEVRCNNVLTNTKVFLGYYDTSETIKAFLCYKEYKEGLIKEVADFYKEEIPNILYEAMLNYKIEVSD